MSRPVHLVALGGSLSSDSTSLAALKLAAEAAQAAGATVELFDVASLDLPLYAPDRHEVPIAARRLATAVGMADGLLLSSPLYHGTVSGAVKNALDWLELLHDHEPAYLTDKPVGLIATSGGSQALQAINTLEFVVRALRGWTVPLTAPLNQAWRLIDESGQILDAKTGQLLQNLGQEVVKAAARFRQDAGAPVTLPMPLLATISRN